MASDEEVPILPAKKRTEPPRTKPVEKLKPVATRAQNVAPRVVLQPKADIPILPAPGFSTDLKDVPAALITPGYVPPPTRVLTPEEIAAREAAKIRIAQIRGGADVVDPIDAVVMQSANPYLMIYRQYRAGQMTLEELYDSIDCSLCADREKLEGFGFKRPPHKPEELIKAEAELHEKCDPEDLKESMIILHRKLSAVKPAVATYIRTVEKIITENRGNLYFLREMHTRQKEKNPHYAGRILEVISTHEAA